MLYQKIPTVFYRDPVTNKLTTQWATPELKALKDIPWSFTEKIDGTNVRILWDGHRVSFGGRTENAQFPIPLLTWLNAKFGGPDNEQLFEQKFGEENVILFGEGYGAGIQSGGKYRPDMSVILFDVRIGNWWLLRDSVEDIGQYFNMDVVPQVLQSVNLQMAIDHVTIGLPSEFGDFMAEGLVGITDTGLLNRRGDRLIVKIKDRDLRIS